LVHPIFQSICRVMKVHLFDGQGPAVLLGCPELHLDDLARSSDDEMDSPIASRLRADNVIVHLHDVPVSLKARLYCSDLGQSTHEDCSTAADVLHLAQPHRGWRASFWTICGRRFRRWATTI